MCLKVDVLKFVVHVTEVYFILISLSRFFLLVVIVLFNFDSLKAELGCSRLLNLYIREERHIK